jgi:DNA-binding transcriptional LysR family regulator
MNLTSLELFVAAADELHFARAAARCRVSTSTFSKRIAELERELRTPPFRWS